MEALINSLVASLLIFGALLFIALFLLRQCHVYAYVDNDGRRVPVRVACITSNGTILDMTKPRGMRRVGHVYVREGKGYVRIFRPDLDEDRGAEEYEELGYVDSDGGIFNMAGDLLSKVSPEGRRSWRDLYLRLHADIPEGDERPDGKCVEALRFRIRKPGEVTLLARGGAAFVLYSQQVKSFDEVPRLARHAMWDTSLIAALLFALTFSIPGVAGSLNDNLFILPSLGPPWSYVGTGVTIYLLLWLLLHFIKITLLYFNNEVLTYLMMLNRETGIENWSMAGVCVSLLGITAKFIQPSDAPLTNYLPVFFSALGAFGLSYSQAPRNPWAVTARSRSERPKRLGPPIVSEGNIVRAFNWEMGGAFNRASVSVELRFREDEIEQIRQGNPFFQNWQDAMMNERRVAEQLVRQGEQAPQIQQLAEYIGDVSRQYSLTTLEEIQTCLNFVQEPNISYLPDAECPEILNAEEYFRLPAETLYDKRGDCDCKAVLAASLLRSLGYPILLLLSSQAQHAALAVGNAPTGSEDGIFFFKYEGNPYYYCETTGDGWKVGQPTDKAWMMLDRQSIIDLRD